MERVILHSDCNCFYASVEMLHHPELAGKPLAVGGDPEQRHGIILTANYIAKRAGVKTGTALWEARQACPGLVIVPPRMDLYLRFSNLTREIYREYSDLVESYGLDECWIDCTQSEACMGNGPDLAAEISARIKRELGITVSIGVSWNKIYAKFGSDYRKPDAITVIDRDNYRDIVWESPVEDLLFVGRATSRKLHRFGILTIGDLAQTDPSLLKDIFGNDTTDPNQYNLGGALMPFCGHKGFSLSVMVETFAGLLSGAASLGDIHAWNKDPQHSGNVGHMFLAVDPSIVQPSQDTEARIEKMVDELIAAKPAPGVDRVLYPGQQEQESEMKARRDGIELPMPTINALTEAGKQTNISFESI